MARVRANLIAIASSLFLSSLTFAAQNKIYCFKSTSNIGSQSCEYFWMPLISQNSNNLSNLWSNPKDPSSSMLCGPTAATMALNTLLINGLTLTSDLHCPALFTDVCSGWTQSNFEGKNFTTQINNMVSLMHTTAGNGTTSTAAERYATRAIDFSKATSKIYKNTSTVLDNAMIIARVNAGEVDTLQYGHYTESCLVISSGKSLCTYKRNGGHFVTINGYTQSNSGSSIRIFDPWFAVIQNYNITPLTTPQQSLGFFASGISKGQVLTRSGNRIEIIEQINGIQTN